MTTVIPGTMRYLHEVSKEEASHWRQNNGKRQIASKYTFPSLPWPIREDWNYVKQLHPYVLKLSYADGVGVERHMAKVDAVDLHSTWCRPTYTCASENRYAA
jgi:hypothetical protein